jgi:hypothetical protein
METINIGIILKFNWLQEFEEHISQIKKKKNKMNPFPFRIALIDASFDIKIK